MTTTTFDPLHVAKELADGGFPEEQANTLARVWAAEDARRRAVDAEREKELATKGDLKDLRFDLLKWGIAVVTTHTVIILGVVYALFQALFQALSLK